MATRIPHFAALKNELNGGTGTQFLRTVFANINDESMGGDLPDG